MNTIQKRFLLFFNVDGIYYLHITQLLEAHMHGYTY